MKVCYAYRRSVFYPYQGGEFPPASEASLVRAYLAKVKATGFDGIELPAALGESYSTAQREDLRRLLRALDLPCAAVRGGDVLKLYVDGVEVARSSRMGPAKLDLANDEPLRIGFGQHDFYNGEMRDVRIYRRGLSGEEIGRLSSSIAP